MCDYSLENVPSRAAQVGDRLVSTQFVSSLTRGFAAIGEPNVAVCVLPGTELVFDQDVECDHPLGLYEKRKLREKVARFRQINLQSPYEHHDALEFPSGKVVLLTRLSLSQCATVLQLPAAPRAAGPQDEAQEDEAQEDEAQQAHDNALRERVDKPLPV